MVENRKKSFGCIILIIRLRLKAPTGTESELKSFPPIFGLGLLHLFYIFLKLWLNFTAKSYFKTELLYADR